MYHGDDIFQTNKAFTELDDQIMKLNAKLRCTTAYLDWKKKDTKQRIRELIDRRNSIESELTNLCGTVRDEMHRMRTEQKSEMANMQNSYLTERDTLAKKLENQLRFRRAEWKIGDEKIFEQIDAFIDLMKYSRDQLPFCDRDPYFFVDKSLQSNIRDCENARVRLQALYLEVDAANHRMGETLDEVTKRQRKLDKQIERRQEKFDGFCQLFDTEEAKMKVAIEHGFRKLLHTESQKTRTAQYNATTRFAEAKSSAEQLEQKRDKFRRLQCPKTVAKNYLPEAKLRVAKVLLSRLQDENNQLRQALQDLAPLTSTTPSTSTISDMTS